MPLTDVAASNSSDDNAETRNAARAPAQDHESEVPLLRYTPPTPTFNIQTLRRKCTVHNPPYEWEINKIVHKIKASSSSSALARRFQWTLDIEPLAKAHIVLRRCLMLYFYDLQTLYDALHRGRMGYKALEDSLLQAGFPATTVAQKLHSWPLTGARYHALSRKCGAGVICQLNWELDDKSLVSRRIIPHGLTDVASSN